MADYSTDKPYHRKLAVSDFATGTDGQVITYDANGNPTTVGPGTTGQVLTSAGAGAPQTFATPTVFNDNALKEDIAIVGFKTAAAGSLAKHNLVDQSIDNFQDATGIDAGSSTNETRNAAKYYSGTSNANATGGTITETGGFTYHSFTANGNFVPPQAGNVEVLMVAGGAGGGTHHGGGGGAGTVINDTSLAVTAQSYALVVGAGAADTGSGDKFGYNGGDSTGFGWTAKGGGGGGYHQGGSNAYQGQTGGNGGGGGGPNGAAGVSNQGSFTTSSGTRTVYANNGTAQSGYSCARGGGAGGGYGSSRQFANFSQFGDGSGNFAGGGGSGETGCAGGGAGAGAGGQGQNHGTAAANHNTGSGGGGGGSYGRNGMGGADGAVLIRYAAGTFVNYQDLTLVSASITAEAVPTKADIVLTASAGVGTLSIGNGQNGDIRVFVSRNNGTNWTQVTLVDEGDTAGHTILVAHDVDISGQPSASNMRYKVSTHSQSASKETRLHAISLGWA